MRTVLALFLLLTSSLSTAQTKSAYSFRLNRADSTEFMDLLKGFSGPKRVLDPEYAELMHTKYWYVSRDNTVAMSCTKTDYRNKTKSVVCDFEFRMGDGDKSFEYLDQEGMVIRAVIQDPVAATQFYQNMNMNVYTSNETVRVETIYGAVEVPRLRFECQATGVLMQAASQCILDIYLEGK